MTGQIIVYLISSATFVFVIYALLDVSTYPPGYLEIGCLTEEEFLSILIVINSE
jgi:hypothetical protein